ncbi:MAG: hypothetical protein K2L51_06240, partial [Clostridiales bacterium]|nr:hypothetical protein [Clostridiales bacterium]
GAMCSVVAEEKAARVLLPSRWVATDFRIFVSPPKGTARLLQFEFLARRLCRKVEIRVIAAEFVRDDFLLCGRRRYAQ